MVNNIVVVVVFSACLLPGVPITLAWVRMTNTLPVRQLVPLYAASLSFVWLVAGLFFPVSLGGYSTTLRYTLIEANLALMLVCSIMAFTKKSALSRTAGTACVMMLIVWTYVAAIN